MTVNVNFVAASSLLSVVLLVCMMLLMEAGRRIGTARLARDPDGLASGFGPAEGAVLGLLGLLIAFTFSGANGRLEDRRHMITDEANAIGTAYLRIDLLPHDAQGELRQLLGRYLDLRLALYANLQDSAATNAKLRAISALQAEIWTKTLVACQRPEAAVSAPLLLLPAVNAMFDIAGTRNMATLDHPPLAIFLFLALLSLMGSLLVGYDMAANKDRNWFHTVVFAAIVSLAVYVTVDLEFPRQGLIRVDAADRALIDLRDSMRATGSNH